MSWDPPSPCLHCRHHSPEQRRGQRGNDRLGWGWGGGGNRNRVLLWEELKVPKNKLGWASQNICIQFQVKSRNVSECLLHTKHSRGPVLFWPCWFPSPSEAIQGRCCPQAVLTPTFLCTLHPHLQTRLRPSLLLFWCSPF